MKRTRFPVARRWSRAPRAALLLAGLAACGREAADPRTPQDVAAELRAADSTFGAAAATLSLIDGVAPMLAADASMHGPPGVWYDGRDTVLGVLRGNSENATSRMTWRPMRVGISADGLHGLTYGYAELVRADSSRVPLKYLTYWIRGADGWRARLWRRVPRPAGSIPDTTLPPLLPAALQPPGDSAAAARTAEEVGAAERAFSDEAGVVGLGEAFRRHGAPDAMNMGGPDSPGFLLGNVAIGAAIGTGEPPNTPSTLTWAGDHRLIGASSGDLGATLGFINIPGADGQPGRRVPFFTIWRRAGPGERWLYVAE